MSRPAGGIVDTQYLTLPDTGAYALLGSRPEWLWGFEHGVNEHRVAIGNEKVWTVDDAEGPAASLGMDLVRLALNGPVPPTGTGSPHHLLETHGQGAGAASGDHYEPYFSSFLIADPRGGWVVETSGRTWAARPVGQRAAIPRIGISLSTDWTRKPRSVTPDQDFQDWRDSQGTHRDRRSASRRDARVCGCRLGLSRSKRTASRSGARPICRPFVSHGDRPWGAPGSDPDATAPVPTEVDEDWNGVTVCMHLADYQATTAPACRRSPPPTPTLVARPGLRFGSPCASVYISLPTARVPAALRHPLTWHRFATLRKQVESGPDELAVVREVLAPLEAELWENADRAAQQGRRARSRRTPRPPGPRSRTRCAGSTSGAPAARSGRVDRASHASLGSANGVQPRRPVETRRRHRPQARRADLRRHPADLRRRRMPASTASRTSSATTASGRATTWRSTAGRPSTSGNAHNVQGARRPGERELSLRRGGAALPVRGCRPPRPSSSTPSSRPSSPRSGPDTSAHAVRQRRGRHRHGPDHPRRPPQEDALAASDAGRATA